MTPVRLEPAALRSRVKHSTTEPLGSLIYVPSVQCFWQIIKQCDLQTLLGYNVSEEKWDSGLKESANQMIRDMLITCCVCDFFFMDTLAYYTKGEFL